MSESASGSRSIITMLVLVVLAGVILALAYYFFQRQPAEPEPAPVVLPAPPPAEEEWPLPTLAPSSPAPAVYQEPDPEPEAEPLPSLNDSDSAVLAELEGLSAQALKLVVSREVIRKFVRAVNAMDEGKVVHEYRPVTSPPPPFVVHPGAEPTADQPRQYRLATENYRRYDNYVTLFAMLDPDALVALYRRFSPLLEEAFGEMGLKKPNFHSVLISAIDQLLAAPIVEDELLLVRPKVFYQFADPELEKLPSTHKLLLRMGPENTRSLQNSLRLLRYKLVQ